MNQFSGARVSVGCILFIFVAMSGNGLYSAGYGTMLETFQVDMVQMGNLTMIISVTGIICSVLLTSIEKRVPLKAILYFDAILSFTVAASTKLFGDSLLTLVLFLLALGATLVLGGHVVMSEIIANWYVKGQARKISTIFGFALIGQAFYQFLSGQMYTRMDLLSVWGILHLINGAVMVFAAKFLIIATDPKQIGQVAYGSHTAAVMVPKESGVRAAAKGHRSIYASPVFWLCLVGDMGLSGGVSYITTYLTTFFERDGIPLDVASVVLSSATVCAAAFSFLNGRMLEWLKERLYIGVLLGAVILANLMMILYGEYSAFFLVFLIVLFYGIGFSGAHAINIVSRVIYEDPAEAANANSKISGIAMVGGLIFLPLSANLAQNVGFAVMYLVIAAVATVSLLCYETALGIASKAKMRNKQGEKCKAQAVLPAEK
mgnify:FL=1